MKVAGDDSNFFKSIEAIDRVQRPSHIDRVLHDVVGRYDLTNIAYLGFNLPFHESEEPYYSLTYSQDWIIHYRDNNYYEIDPVFREGLRTLLPLDWKSLDRSQRAVQNLFGEAAEFGIGKQGLVIPVRGRVGDIALCVLNSDVNDAQWSLLKKSFIRDFQLLAVHLHQGIMRANGAKGPEIELSKRERECLFWAASGKTNSEIAEILGISRRGVRFHIDNSIFKLDCVNVTQTVAKAVAFEIINIPK